MIKKLYISLVCSALEVSKLLVSNHRMHNLYAIVVKFHDICKQFAGNLVNESGNVPSCGVIPEFSDLEVVALSMTAETESIDSENLLFSKLSEYKEKFSSK